MKIQKPRKPRLREMFHMVPVGEVPPYVPVFLGFIVSPLVIINSLRHLDYVFYVVMMIVSVFIMIINILLAKEVIQKTKKKKN